MAKSSRPRVGDVTAALRVVGECRDLGYDPGVWRPHAFAGLARLVGARVAAGGEVRWRPGGPMEPIDAAQVGFTPDDLGRYFVPYVRDHGPGADILLARMNAVRGRHVVRTRRQVVTDREWHGSATYTAFYRPVGVDHSAGSRLELPGGRADQIGLHRAAGERDFSAREVALVRLFHRELGGLIGPVLVSPDDPLSPSRLPPRVRETLTCLLDGDGEKQVATRLGLSRVTVHHYVTALYRHYRVASRAELLARVLRRARPGSQST